MATRGLSSAPAKTICRRSGIDGLLELGHDLRHVARRDAKPMAIVDRHDRRPAATSEAFDGAEREATVRGRRARLRAELALECLQYLLRSTERAGDVRAHLDERAPDRLEPELVVERRDREAVRGSEIERFGDVPKRLGRKPAAMLLLREPQRRQDGGRALRILRAELAQTGGQRGAHQR